MDSSAFSLPPDRSRQLLFALGRPLAPLYGAAMRLRAALYDRGILRRHRLPVPVISIGNLTLGGTGKTPLVQYLARELAACGWRPAVISRGYGGSASARVNVVSDGHRLLLAAPEAGDEPRMLAESLPGVPVLTGVVRRLPAQYAVQRLDADLLLLDDGFQHLALQRDIDLVLFSADTLAGNSRVFPGGVLREPVSALHRCSAFALTAVSDGNRQRAERFADLLRQRFPGRPIFFLLRGMPRLLQRVDATTLTALVATQHPTVPLQAFCGIAQPESFRHSLQSLGLSLAGLHALADHQRYDDRTWAQVQRAAHTNGAAALVTTWKDFVKLQGRISSLPLYILAQDLPPQDELLDWIGRRLPLPAMPAREKNHTAL